jgi:thiamine biosynthesis lipoprotein
VLAASGSIRDLAFAGTAISAQAGRYTLDLGGIAKGAAVDRIVERLEGLGIAPALVNAGGNLRVIGERADRSWRVGVQAPRGEGLLGTLTLAAGEAIASSGDYERFRESDSASERLHHILDPGTGRPVAHTEAVTVIAKDALTADAGATALFVAGPGAWLEVAERLGIEAALRVDASGRIEMSPAMRERFQPGAEAASAIIAVAD